MISHYLFSDQFTFNANLSKFMNILPNRVICLIVIGSKKFLVIEVYHINQMTLYSLKKVLLIFIYGWMVIHSKPLH
jgi:hypothetical protein